VHGSRKKYHHEILGVNSRLDALQAAILRVKLRYLDEWTKGRQNRAARYVQLFAEASLLDRVTLPQSPDGYHHVYNQFTIRCSNRDALRQYLQQKGIPTEIYYPISLHLQPAFSYLGYKEGQMPNSELASREALSLPVFPELSDEQQDSVVEAITEFYSQRN
jgi:dTDP-4-amino-4,6-dideoxygalactose transaminase